MVQGKTRPVNIEEELKGSYLDYAMSVIVSRALPDVRDGLKPVHRRILYVMDGLGLRHNSAHKKSARVVGDVLGKYHPHGDTSVYDAMVRMAQDFSMRYPLVDGQGNFGSMDNDPPAAMRYTEVRLAAISEEMLVDIDKDTVNFMPNFDDSLQEPTVLPARLPNLLVNGSSGIAVGMTTNIPPHNLTEVCDAISHLIDNPEATVEDLMQFVKGPDFPTAGIILGQEGIKNAYATGHGRIVVQAKAIIDEIPGTERHQIIVTELPYQTDKAALVARIAELAKTRKIVGISDLRDESDRLGMRVVIELARTAQPRQVLNSLFKFSGMQSAFFVNMLALVDGSPKVISLKEALEAYVDFRREVITRRCKFELKIAKERAHILEGLKIALDHIDAVISTIRKSENADIARKNLMANFNLSQIQAQAILDMQLRRLANLERKAIYEEYAQVIKTIAYLEDLLANPRKILEVVKQDVTDLKNKYGDARRTQITGEEAGELSEEDLIPHQRVAVTLSQRGFIKRVPAQEYRLQHRGGKGIIGMVTREADAIRILNVVDTHDYLLFFTNRGRVFRIKCYEIPADSSRIAKGTAIVNFFPIPEGEKVTAMVPASPSRKNDYLLLATRKGEIKKSALENFDVVRSNGLIAMDLTEGDELVAASLANDKDDIVLITEKGESIRFKVTDLRAASRTSGGVRGIRLAPDDKLMSMDVIVKDGYVLVLTANGYGKITPVDEYPLQHRGGGGVKTFRVTDKSGPVATGGVVTLAQQLMIISAEGIVTRTPVKEKDPSQGITPMGRSTQGVRVMKLDAGDRIVSIACFDVDEAPNKNTEPAKP